MRIFRKMALAAIAFAGVALASCEDTKSYAELLTDETHYVNAYLANHRVVAEIPADTVFETGEDAPYYRLDEDGNMYMQVLDAGTKGNKVKADEQIYFRFTRWSLYNYSGGELSGGAGNENDLSFANTWFRYGNYQLQTSSQWGSGIQYPLSLLPVDCEVNIVIKSQLGLTSEIAEVVPFLYHIRYYRPKI
ncbi:MAG: DUF4827 family protein [Muribaculaceae bacterium]|nr:DUF4827 family protein [Muribaculaceae bacterium]